MTSLAGLRTMGKVSVSSTDKKALTTVLKALPGRLENTYPDKKQQQHNNKNKQ